MTKLQEAEQRIIARAMKDKLFRKQLLDNPKAVLARELGESLPDKLEVKLIEETKDTIVLVLPRLSQEHLRKPELSAEELDAVVGGEGSANDTECAFHTHCEEQCSSVLQQ